MEKETERYVKEMSERKQKLEESYSYRRDEWTLGYEVDLINRERKDKNHDREWLIKKADELVQNERFKKFHNKKKLVIKNNILEVRDI